MSGHDDTPATKSHAVHFALYILGGLCVGIGLLNLYWSFGYPEGSLNTQLTTVGFSGLDNIMALGPADYSVPLVVIGLMCLIYGNVIAWKHTGGY